MVKDVASTGSIKIPSDVDVEIDGRRVKVIGPLGSIARDFSHAGVVISKEMDEIKVETRWPRKAEAALVGTITAHLRNMIKGVTKGFTYRLKVVYAHFPISVKKEDDRVIIENFSGERFPRKAEIVGGAKVSIVEDEVLVQGIDLEEVSQTAANIEKATSMKDKDPRVFLDGIYVFEKKEGM